MIAQKNILLEEGEDEDHEQQRQRKKYHLNIDHLQDDKATEIKLRQFSRPHMRAFHCSWFAFFVAFMTWFSISPLLPEIQKTLNLTDSEVWNSNIASVSSTIFMRFLLGPLCDQYGARILFLLVLTVASIPTFMTGLVNSANGLMILRFFIGISGGSFVMCQYWSSRMFTKELVSPPMNG